MLRSSSIVALVLIAFAADLRAQSTAPDSPAAATVDATEALLDRLVGRWRMVGQVRGRPVTYALDAQRTLAGRYVELHMIDVTTPPQYEARVIIGADTVPGRVIVHWLDSFGAAYSIPHGEGHVRGDTIRFDVPYRTGPFRDTFIHRGERGWLFRIEASDGTGGWRLFAEYDVTRR